MKSFIPVWSKILASFGFILIYIPIIVMICYSFNSGKLSSVWAGFSFKWYLLIFTDQKLMSGLIKSILIASISATLSLFLGFLLAFSLTKIKRFWGKNILFLSIAPIVMQSCYWIVLATIFYLFRDIDRMAFRKRIDYHYYCTLYFWNVFCSISYTSKIVKI